MSHFSLSNILLFFSLFIIINSVIKFNIKILNETYTFDHDKIYNESEQKTPIINNKNKNLYLCENITNCLSCNFRLYQYAQCIWDVDHKKCKTEYLKTPFDYSETLNEIYDSCFLDEVSNQKMTNYCGNNILLSKKDETNQNSNLLYDESYKIDYENLNNGTLPSFKNLLCKYEITNNFGSNDSIFHLNITKFFRYINILVELDYGLYFRYINVKYQKKYEIDTVGVKHIKIFVYTPEDYNVIPYSIFYGFIVLKTNQYIKIVIALAAIIVFILLVLLVIIFVIEVKKINLVPKNRNGKNLNLNTLIFNAEKYTPYYHKQLGEKCFFCSENFLKFDWITKLKCRKHIFHYDCLLDWVKEKKFDKTNFFCPLCKQEQDKLTNDIKQNTTERDNFLIRKLPTSDFKNEINKNKLIETESNNCLSLIPQNCNENSKDTESDRENEEYKKDKESYIEEDKKENANENETDKEKME